MAGKQQQQPNSKVIIGITTKKQDNFAAWYQEVITKAELIEYYDVSGCYILRPWAYHVWEQIQEFMNKRFKRYGIQNAYFPSFVTKGKLEVEQDHLEGFAAEVAWVTKYGKSDLPEHIAIRPTSETIMYPAFAKWIRSHRDLPLKLNQWCAVVRWEFSHPTPFIRTREFLWQEGHTAHENASEAEEFAKKMQDVYRATYEELLAVPVIPGQKSNLEKFAGGHTTYTVETYIPATGRAIQAATSHYLASNFAKMFEVEFEDSNRQRQKVHQTSFGFSTRSIGALVMIHGDDKGLVLPPRVATFQVVVVPIVKKDCDEKSLYDACRKVSELLSESDIRVECDDRTIYNPGWKYNHWEMKGVPIRLEIGPRDVLEGTCRIVRRFDGHKEDIKRDDQLVQKIKDELDYIHQAMLNTARTKFMENIVPVNKFKDVMPALRDRKILSAPWCGEDQCEEKVKAETARLSKENETTEQVLSGSMKTLCIPMNQEPEITSADKCFHCGAAARKRALWGRSY